MVTTPTTTGQGQSRPDNRNAAGNPGNPAAKLPSTWERHAIAARRQPLPGPWNRALTGVGATIAGAMATTDGPIGWTLLPESDPRYDADRPFRATIDGRPARLPAFASPAEAQDAANRLYMETRGTDAGWANVRRLFAA